MSLPSRSPAAPGRPVHGRDPAVLRRHIPGVGSFSILREVPGESGAGVAGPPGAVVVLGRLGGSPGAPLRRASAGDREARSERGSDRLHLCLPAATLAAIAGAEGLPLPAGPDIRADGPDDPILSRLASRLLAALADPGTMDPGSFDGLVAALAAYVLKSYGPTGDRSRAGRCQGLSPLQLSRAQALIESSLETGIALAGLAAACGMSPACFAKAFQRSTGRTPHRWLVARRVQRARDLLGGDDATISEVALACGFSDQSHLTRIFSAATGETPGAYRRAVRGQEAAGLSRSRSRGGPGS